MILYTNAPADDTSLDPLGPRNILNDQRPTAITLLN